MDLYIDVTERARKIATNGKRDDANEYYKMLSKLMRIMYPHIQPTGKLRRFIKRWGLARNPFKHCSDLEVMDITNFFLQGRMKSSVQPLEEAIPATSGTQTF